MPLTDTQIKAAKGAEKPYKLSDADGLYLLVTPKGKRLWRFRYRQPKKAPRPVEEGKAAGRPENIVSLGEYPVVTLAAAREKALTQRRLLSDDKDPAVERKAERNRQATTFEAVAQEWLGKQPLSASTRKKADWMLALVIPDIGSKPIGEIEAPDVLQALRKIEARGRHETAHRVKQRISQVFRYAVATGSAKHDVTSGLRGALTPVTATHHASIKDPAKIGPLLRAIDGYDGEPTTAAALRLAPLVFVRPGELRAAEWSEFDLKGAEPTWRIPGPKMKMGEDHIVPLSRQAVAVVRALHPHTGHGKYLFPSIRSPNRPMSDNTINAALRRLGYTSEQMTGHGFRSMASTRLNEATEHGKKQWHEDWIEVQLAHGERDKVRGAYNAAEYLHDRRRMLQWWADYLDGLKAAKRAA